MYQIHEARPYITKCVCHSLVIVLVVSHLDYCNALLLDMPEYHMTRLQKIHNRAARLVVLTHTWVSLCISLQFWWNCIGCLSGNQIKSTGIHTYIYIYIYIRTGVIYIYIYIYIYNAMHDLEPDYLSELLNQRRGHPI